MLRGILGSAGGPPVGGSGTTNTIPRWTGATTLGNSGLIDDGTQIYTTTRNVGIGTASPAFKLEVSAGTAAAMRLVSDSGTATVLRLLQTANRDWGIRIPASSTSLSFYDYSAGQERMVIDLNGNIYAGSGTTGMTNGFFHIPAAAGAPTGVPSAISGRVPMYYDTTNNKFYVYNGAWKQVALT